MNKIHDPYDAAEKGLERAEQWKHSADDPVRSGQVEQWKLITPKLRPDEPVWLLEARGRDDALWSKFISQAALQSKLIGRNFGSDYAAVQAADPADFAAQVGDYIAVKFEGEHPSADKPGQTVTRWGVSIVKAADVAAETGGEGADSDIPF